MLPELAKLAFFDIRELYNADGSLKSITELDGDMAGCRPEWLSPRAARRRVARSFHLGFGSGSLVRQLRLHP